MKRTVRAAKVNVEEQVKVCSAQARQSSAYGRLILGPLLLPACAKLGCLYTSVLLRRELLGVLGFSGFDTRGGVFASGLTASS